MHLKDYYHELELEPSASLPEIKKAYRRLAQRFHPDKNNGDHYAAARFTIIKEAYEVLSNPSRKEYYLQQRWYNQSMGRKKTESVITPVTVLKQALELDKYVSALDIHRMDKPGLFSYISALVSDETLSKLAPFDEPAIKKEIVFALLHSSKLLSPAQFAQLAARFKKLSPDPSVLLLVEKSQLDHLRRERWEKYKPVVLLVIVAAVCALILFLNP